MPKRSALFSLIPILLLAAAARIVHLTQQSLWFDEGFAYSIVSSPDMFPLIAADTHPPLYYVLLRLWIAFAGDSVLALRLFSALAGILTVAVVYRIAGELERGQVRMAQGRAPIFAALLLALADSEMVLGQETRMYTWHLLFACLSVWSYLRWVRQPTPARAAWWIGFTAALVHTYYLGLYMPLIEGLHALIFLRGRQRIAAVGALALAGLIFLPWFLGVTLDQIRTPPPYEMFQSRPSNGDALVFFLPKYFTGQWALWIGLALLGLVALAPGANGRDTVRWRPLGSTVFAALWLVLPVAITFVGNFWLPILTERKISMIAPAVAILVGRGLANLRHPARGLLLAAIVLYGVTTVDDFLPKPPWNVVGEKLARYALPGQVALMEVGNDGHTLNYYLQHLMPAGTPIRSLPQWREADPDGYPTRLMTLVNAHDTVWLAAWGDEHPIFDQLRDWGYVRTMTLTTDHVGNALNAFRYDRLPADPLATFVSGMVLRAAEVHPEAGRVDLWWSADEPLAADYTVSVFLLDEAGALAAQNDSYPFLDARPTTSWAAGEVVYDPRALDVASLPPGRYTVGVKVYTWWDGTVFPAGDGREYVAVGVWDR